MVTREELSAACGRVLAHHGITSDMEVVALALQRFLVVEDRKPKFDRRVYMRRYMEQWRKKRRMGGAGKGRKSKAKGR